jgi:outer membrane lipoprotein-sorting protein
MRILPLACLLATALVLAGCAATDADESRSGGQDVIEGSGEVSGHVTVVDSNSSTNQTGTGGANSTAPR